MSAQLKLAFDEPLIGVGFWRLRNGNTVEIVKRLTLHCAGPNGKFLYDVWAGHCLCCHAKFTWHLDGRYAAVGSHDFDIVGAAA